MRIDVRQCVPMGGRRGKVGAVILALAALGVSGWAQSLAQGFHLLDAAILFGSATVLLAVATRRQADLLTHPPHAPSQPSGVDPWDGAKKLGAILLTAGIGANIAALALFRLGNPGARVWATYLASLALALPGLWLLARGRQLRQTSTRGAWELLAICLFVLVGAFMRLHQLDQQPAGLFYDEAMYGLDAQSVLRREALPVYFEDNFGRGPLYIYLLAGFIKLFGASALTLRLASVAIGIATIPALYVFVRLIAGRQPALIAALLLAVSRWHVNFSRIAFDAITLPLLELIVFYFLVRGLRNGRRADLVFAGIAAGLGLNGYVAFRLVPLIAACYVAKIFLPSSSSSSPARAERLNVILGLAALLLATVLVASPFLQLYQLHPEVVNQRLNTASVFADKDLGSGARGLLENAREHLLMFNVRGDPNGRHNLPGEPMLDFVTAALFVLGFGHSLTRLARREHGFLLVWFFLMLAAGVLSVDFEAPQALRSIGALPPAIIFAALGLAWLPRLAAKHGGLALRAAGIIVAGTLAVSAYLNYGNYFVRQATSFASWNDFSTGQTLAAQEMHRLGPAWRHYVSSVWHDDPTIRFLAPETKGYQRLLPTDRLPLRENGDRDVALFLDSQQAGLFDEAKRYYPNATLKEFVPPFGGPPSMLEVLLTREDLRGAQGLDGSYFAAEDWSGPAAVQRRDSAIDFDWSSERVLAPPFSVEWRGILRVDTFAWQTLGIQSPAAVEVRVDGAQVLSASGEQRLRLAKGNHALTVRAVIPSAAGRTTLYWRGPSGQRTAARSDLYAAPVSSAGLLGSYFPNGRWSGDPALQQIDPFLGLYFHITPLPRPYSVEWRGQLQAPVSGEYAFGLESIDDSWLQIDGVPVVEAHEPNKYEERRVTLKAGWHRVAVRYLDQSGWSHINFYWIPPGGRREIVPATRLLPAEAADTLPAADINPPAAALGQSAKSAVVAPGPARSLLALGERAGPLKEPKDVLVAKDGSVLVADAGNNRVVRFAPDGRLLGQIGAPGDEPGQLRHPVGLATLPDGDILVLDEESGFVNRFAPGGQFRQRFAGPGTFFHPRAVAAGEDGTIYVADTGFARIVVYNDNGVKKAELGSKGSDPGQLLGPISVTIDAEGALWVLDSENGRVQRLSAGGQYLGSFGIPPGESVDGAHLALAADRVYVSDPLANVVRAYSYEGRLLSEWAGADSGRGRLSRPVGLAVDAAGNVWVAERDANRVQQFRLEMP